MTHHTVHALFGRRYYGRQALFPWWNFGRFYLLSCLHCHFGNDHNILYSVNMKRRACSGNATSSSVVLSTVIEHVSPVLYLVYIPRSSSTQQFYDEQKIRKYGMSLAMRKILVVGGNGFVGLSSLFQVVRRQCAYEPV